MTDSVSRKREVRAWVRQQRSQVRDESNQRGLTAQLQRLVTELEPRSLTCFLPVRGEPDTRAFIDWARHGGIDVLLPAAREDCELDWVRANSEPMVRGAFGIDVPTGERLEPEASHAVDLMLVPAAAVDQRGTRLGWGRGYYDRNLAAMAQRPPVFAVVFDEEVLEHLPAEAHDVPMSGVVTPTRIMRFMA